MIDEHSWPPAPWEEREHVPSTEEYIDGYGVGELLHAIGPDEVADWLEGLQPWRECERGRHFKVFEYGDVEDLREELAATLREAGWTVTPPAGDMEDAA